MLPIVSTTANYYNITPKRQKQCKMGQATINLLQTKLQQNLPTTLTKVTKDFTKRNHLVISNNK
jgi:hypothetical protein